MFSGCFVWLAYNNRLRTILASTNKQIGQKFASMCITKYKLVSCFRLVQRPVHFFYYDNYRES